MKKMSLRKKLTISFLCIATGLWAIAGTLSVLESRDYMDEFFDTYQLLLARQLASADWSNAQKDTQHKTDKVIEQLKNDGEEDDEALGFAIFNNEGKMLIHDGENGRFFSFNPKASGFANEGIGHKKKPWRIVWVKTFDKNFVVAVGQELEYREEAALELAAQSLIPWIGGLLLLIIISIFMISRELKPLRTIAYNLSSRNPNDLSPLSLENIPSEVEPLVSAMNRLFEKINTMLKRERSFISDSAHELRSPLTALKVQLEVALLADDDKPTRERALENLQKGIDRSTHLVEQLLALSRLEANSAENIDNNDFFDWKTLVEEIFFEQKDAMEKKNISTSFETEDNAFPANGSYILWSLLVKNLLINATKYSPENAHIKVIINKKGIAITNSNTKVNEDILPNLGKRFFRPAGQKENGSGLGLSIVGRIAEIHNCKVKFANTEQGFKVSIIKI